MACLFCLRYILQVNHFNRITMVANTFFFNFGADLRLAELKND
jgi:hypothetical protein